jgi:cell division septation protein DedD/CheY-like chemotaxis protein
MTRNILIIEGDFEAGRAMARALEGEGYFVFTASSAQVGLLMARRVRPSLVILDPAAKSAGGIEYTKKLRSIDRMKKIPILLFSDEKEYEPGYGQAYGVVNFLGKPLDINEVVYKSKASLEGIPQEEERDAPLRGMQQKLFQVEPSPQPEPVKSLKEEIPLIREKKKEEARAPEVPIPNQPEERADWPRAESPMKEDLPLGEDFSLEDPPLNRIEKDAPPTEDMPQEKTEPKEIVEEEPAPAPIRSEKIKPEKKKREPLTRGKVFFYVFFFLLGVMGSLGYFFFFLPAQKEELAIPLSTNKEEVLPIAAAAPPAETQAQAPPAGNPVQQTALAPAPGTGPVTEATKGSVKEKTDEPAPGKPETASSKPLKGENLYAVQLGVFKTKENARKLEKKLESKGYKPYTKEERKGSKKIIRVLVGKYDSAEKARKTAVKLKKDGFNPVHYSE